MEVYKKSLELHEKLKGKIEVCSKKKIKNKEDMSLLYTPGVAQASKEIHKNIEKIYDLTVKHNFIAVISDGSAVLGLGNIGPYAAMPVMEGKALLFKEFANVDAIPLCIDTQDVDEIINFVKLISPTFGGINFEDISAPRCFEIEERLKGDVDIPFFHDDQHGTAIVVGAALMNALKIVNKKISEVKIVINGIGAAGYSISNFLLKMGVKNIIAVDKNGILNPYNKKSLLHEYHLKLAKKINENGIDGNLEQALKGADVFIGVSKGNILKGEWIRRMNKDPIIFAMANPTPEIHPEEAKENGAKIIATGRSDYPNQVNNVLAFPGVFRGVLDVRAKEINDEMKLEASKALAKYWEKKGLKEDSILPPAFDKEAVKEVAYATAKKAIETKVARIEIEENKLKKVIEKNIYGSD